MLHGLDGRDLFRLFEIKLQKFSILFNHCWPKSRWFFSLLFLVDWYFIHFNYFKVFLQLIHLKTSIIYFKLSPLLVFMQIILEFIEFIIYQHSLNLRCTNCECNSLTKTYVLCHSYISYRKLINLFVIYARFLVFKFGSISFQRSRIIYCHHWFITYFIVVSMLNYRVYEGQKIHAYIKVSGH